MVSLRHTIWIALALFLQLEAQALVVWFDGVHPISYQVPKKAEPVLTIALEIWKGDMQQVTGMMPGQWPLRRQRYR